MRTVIMVTLALGLAPGLAQAGQHKGPPAKGGVVAPPPTQVWVDHLYAPPSDIVLPPVPVAGTGPQAGPAPVRR